MVSIEDVEQSIADKGKLIDKELEKFLPMKKGDNLYEAVWYHMGTGGKRIRPALAIMACESLGGDGKKAVPFAAACFTPETSVLMEDNTEKPISEVKVGERVVCHNSSGAVLATSKRMYNGHIRLIKPRGFSPLEVTPEHPFLAVKRKDVSCKFPCRKSEICHPERKCCKKPNNDNWKPEWIKAKDLVTGDFLVSPIPKGSTDIGKMDILDFIDFNGYSDEKFYGHYGNTKKVKGKIRNMPRENIREKYSKRTIPRYIETTSDFLRLIGYFLAEGCFKYEHKKKRREQPSAICFAFSLTEKKYVDDVANITKEIFKIEPVIMERPRNNKIDITIHNISLAKFFKELCGEYAEHKKLHPKLMALPPQKQAHIIEGFFRGDGHEYKKRKYLTTISRILANQLWIILQRMSEGPVIQEIRAPRKKCVYRISVSVLKKVSKRFYLNDYLFAPISEIRNKHYGGIVCNLEVENYNSYVANKLCAHNCELMHNWLLVHDDIEDGDEVRRNQPTVWKKYGVPHAINVGDLMSQKVFQIILDSKAAGVDDKTTMQLLNIMAETAVKTAEGQAMDIGMRGKEPSEKDYMEMVTGKTAYYFMAPIIGGAMIGGAAKKDIERIIDFGKHAGPAFQIADDILDLTEGKGRGETGRDIKEGKRSIMAIHCLSRCTPGEKRAITEILNKKPEDTTKEDVQFVKAMFERYRSIEYSRKKAEELTDKARHAIKPLPDDLRGLLEMFADYLISRKK